MNKQDMLKIQSCVLRVNIHCDGCKHKVKKQLHKVEGVYKVSIDVEQGKVTVSGNVDPETLIKKLEKSGKHAELWGPQKGGPIPILNNQFFKDFQIGNNNGGKEGKLQKGAKEQQNGFKNLLKNGIQAPQQMPQKKGLKEEKFFGKDQKSVKFNLPPEDDDNVYSDEFDSDDEDEFDDEFDEDFAAHPPPKKGPGSQANKEAPNGHVKGKSGANNVGKPKKVGGIDAFLKGMLGKVGGKNGNVGKKGSKKAENHKEDGGKNSKKNGKNGSKSDKGVTHNGKANDSWTKKVGENYDGGPKLKSKKQVFDEIHTDYKGGSGGGGGSGSKNMNPTGQMGNFPAVEGLPAAAAAMNFGSLQGAGQGNAYNQGAGQGNPYHQQYMQHMMMMMNQQRENGYDSFHPSAYMRPQPPMGYGTAPMGYGPAPMVYGAAPAGYGPAPSDRYTHIFNDEDTDSCSIM